MNTKRFIHLSGCEICRLGYHSAANRPVECAICGRWMHDGERYYSFDVCCGFDGMKVNCYVWGFCSDCYKLIQDPSRYYLAQYKSALEEFKRKLGLK